MLNLASQFFNEDHAWIYYIKVIPRYFAMQLLVYIKNNISFSTTFLENKYNIILKNTSSFLAHVFQLEIYVTNLQ